MGVPTNSPAYNVPAAGLNNPRPAVDDSKDPWHPRTWSNPTLAPGTGGQSWNPGGYWNPGSGSPPLTQMGGGAGTPPPAPFTWPDNSDTNAPQPGGNPRIRPQGPPRPPKPNVQTAPEFSNIAKQPPVSASAKTVAPVYNALPDPPKSAPGGPFGVGGVTGPDPILQAPGAPTNGPQGGPGRLSTPNMATVPMKPTAQTAGGMNSGAGGYQTPQWQGQPGAGGDFARKQGLNDYNPYRRGR